MFSLERAAVFMFALKLVSSVNVVFFLVGAERGQPGPVGDQEHVGGAAGCDPDPLRQTAPSGERESPAQIQDPRPGDGETFFSISVRSKRPQGISAAFVHRHTPRLSPLSLGAGHGP